MATAYEQYLAEQAAAAIYGGGGSDPYAYDPYAVPIEEEDPYRQPQPQQQPEPYLDPGYTLDQGYAPQPMTQAAEPPPDYVLMPGEEQPYNPSTGEFWEQPPPEVNPANAWLAPPPPDPSRNPQMPEPQLPPAEQAITGPTDPNAAAYENARVEYGDDLMDRRYSTGEEAADLWGDPAATQPVNPDLVTLSDIYDERVTAVDAELERQEQLQADQQAAALAAATNYEARQYQAGNVYSTGPDAEPEWYETALEWTGDRLGDVGESVGPKIDAARQIYPLEHTGNALGWVGDRLVQGVKNIPSGEGGGEVRQAGIDPFGFVDESTPFLGGVQHTLTEAGENVESAENVQELAAALPVAAIDTWVPWRQSDRGVSAYEFATGERADSSSLTDFGQLPADFPLLGGASMSIERWAREADPDTKWLIRKYYEDAEAQEPGSGGMAVYDLYTSYINPAQEVWQDLESDVTVALPPGRAAAGAVTAAGRGMRGSRFGAIRSAAPAVEYGGAGAKAVLGSADELVDLGITSGMTGIGRKIQRSRMGKPFQLTEDAQAQLAYDEAFDVAGSAQRTFREAGSPAANMPEISGGIPGSRFGRDNARVVDRYGDYRLIENDRGESIITLRESSDSLTDRPMTREQADAVLDELRAGASRDQAKRFADGLRNNPDGSTREIIQQHGNVNLETDVTGDWWITDARTRDTVHGPLSRTDAVGQLDNADAAVREGRSETFRAASEGLESDPLPPTMPARRIVTDTGQATPDPTMRTPDAGEPAYGPGIRRSVEPTGDPETPGMARTADSGIPADPYRTQRTVGRTPPTPDQYKGWKSQNWPPTYHPEADFRVHVSDAGGLFVAEGSRGNIRGWAELENGRWTIYDKDGIPLQQTTKSAGEASSILDAYLRKGRPEGRRPRTPRTADAGVPADPNRVQRLTTTPEGPVTPPGVQRQYLNDQAAELSRVRRTVQADPNAEIDLPGMERTADAGVAADPSRLRRTVTSTDPATPDPTMRTPDSGMGADPTRLRRRVSPTGDETINQPGMERTPATPPRQLLTQEDWQQSITGRMPPGARPDPGEAVPLRTTQEMTAGPEISGVGRTADAGTPAQLAPPDNPTLRREVGHPFAPVKATAGRNQGRFTIPDGTPDGRLITPQEYDGAYRAMMDMPEAEYLGDAASAWRQAMYGRRAADGGQFLRKTPQVEPTVAVRPDGRYHVIHGRTGRPLRPDAYKGQKLGESYPSRSQADQAVRQLQGKVQEQKAAYDRYVKLLAHRLKRDPSVEAAMRDPRVGDPVPDSVLRDVKEQAEIPPDLLPPAPNGHAVDLMTGERVIVPPRQPGAPPPPPREGPSFRERAARPSYVQKAVAEPRLPETEDKIAKYRKLNLSEREIEQLEMPMPKTHGPDAKLIDVQLRYNDELTELSDLARMSALNTREQKRLDELISKFNTTADELRAIDPATREGLDQLDDILFRRLGPELEREFRAVGTREVGRVGAVWSDLRRFQRSFTLYNRTKFGRYISTNWLGNPMTAGIGGRVDTALRSLFDIREYIKVHARLRGRGAKELRPGKTRPDRLHPDETTYGSISRNLGHAPRQGVAKAQTRDQLDQLWGFGENDPAWKRKAGAILQSEEEYWVAQAVDQGFREISATAIARDQLPAMVREIRRHAKESAQRMGVYVTDAQIDDAIETLAREAAKRKGNAGLPAFSQYQLEKVLADLPVNAGPNPQTWANRVARDWREATTKLMDGMEAEANRIAFSFRQTNIDSALSNVLFFHYWASRASKLYVTSALKNPYLMASYASAMEGLQDWSKDQGLPKSVEDFVRLFDSLGGYAGFVEPNFFLPAMLAQAEDIFERDGEYGLTQAGKVLAEINNVLGILPFWRYAAHYSGLEGGSREPDIFYSFRDTLGTVANIINHSGWLGVFGLNEAGDAGILPAPVRTISNQVAHWFSGLLANEVGLGDVGFKQVPQAAQEVLNSEYQLRQIVADIVAEQAPELTAQQQAAAIDEIMADPSRDEYQEAYGRWNVMRAAKVAAKPVPVRTQIRNEANDERSAIIHGGMMVDPQSGELRPVGESLVDQQEYARQKREAEAITNAVRRGSPEDAAYDAALTEYFASFDREGHNISNNYWGIAKGEVTQSFKVKGRTYTPADIAAMDDNARFRLADEWLEGISAVTGFDAQERMDTRYDAQNAIAEANPELAGVLEFRARADEYPGGPDLFIRDTAEMNKPYRDYLSALSYPEGSDEYRGAATSYRAAQIASGIDPDIFNTLQSDEGRGQVAGLPTETSLSSAWHIRQEEREAEEAAKAEERAEKQAGWHAYVDETSESLRFFSTKLDERVNVLRQAGVSDADIDVYLSRVAKEWDGKLPDHIYRPLRDAFGSDNIYAYPMRTDGTGSKAAFEFWQARRRDPNLDLSDFLSRRSAANKAEREAFDPNTDLTGVPSQSAPASAPQSGAPQFDARSGLNRAAERAALGPGDLDPSDPSLSDTGPIAPGGMVGGILGGAATTTDFGFRHPTNLGFYKYFEGHGGSQYEHTGVDATGYYGQPMYAPASGVVTCAGTDDGPGSWGTGCAEFRDDAGGAGRIEIMLDDGSSLILGHSASSQVRPGDRVRAGQLVGTMGIANDVDHVHIERRVWDAGSGTYRIVDPEF